MPALPYCFSLLRGGQELPNSRPNGVMLAPCWHIWKVSSQVASWLRCPKLTAPAPPMCKTFLLRFFAILFEIVEIWRMLTKFDEFQRTLMKFGRFFGLQPRGYGVQLPQGLFSQPKMHLFDYNPVATVCSSRRGFSITPKWTFLITTQWLLCAASAGAFLSEYNPCATVCSSRSGFFAAPKYTVSLQRME